MPEIALLFSEKNFEYDVYTLVKAFYPQAEIQTCYEGEDPLPGEPDIRMGVRETDDSFVFSVSSKEKEALVRTKAVPDGIERADRKNILKQLVYTTHGEYTGIELPWGDLTGIRPVKIPMSMLEQGMSNPDIAKKMREIYFTSAKKTALAIAVANREKALLDKIDTKDGYSLYVGIPFCPSICLYCSFGSHPIDRFGKMVEPYLQALYKELEHIAAIMAGRKLTCIYIGGGTPTSLDAAQLDGLLSLIENNFPMKDVVEFTVEAGRPDTITEEKLYVCLAHGVSRISINPQTMNQKTLDLIGRKHTTEQIETAFAQARKIGFDNINMDIIAGLPGEGTEEVRATLEKIEKLGPDGLTVHSLALKRSSRLNYLKDEYAGISFHNSGEIMDSVQYSAGRMGMQPYYLYRQKNIAGNLENVGYAREGCFGIYNILIMEEKQTIMAAGSAAISKYIMDDGRIERTANVKDIYNYIERIDEMIEKKETAVREYLK